MKSNHLVLIGVCMLGALSLGYGLGTAVQYQEKENPLPQTKVFFGPRQFVTKTTNNSLEVLLPTDDDTLNTRWHVVVGFSSSPIVRFVPHQSDRTDTVAAVRKDNTVTMQVISPDELTLMSPIP